MKLKLKFLKRYNLKKYKFFLAITVIALSILGVMVIGSAKESVQSRQILGLLVGIVAMIIVSLFDYNWVVKFAWILYGLNILLLGLVPIIGVRVNGAKRWIDLGFTTFQPSELTKILLIVFFAKFLSEREEIINDWKLLLEAAVLFAIPAVLVMAQPDLSTTISLSFVFVMLVYLTGLSYKRIGTILLIVVPLTVLFISYAVQPNQIILKDYQQERILAWLQPEKYADDEAYQQTNSIIAIGSGQAQGKGLNNNTTTSVKNGNFISEPQTDFIFAIIGEELGFVGCCVVITLLLLIVIQCIIIGVRAQNLLGRLIGCGVACQIGIQGFINIAVATGVFPNTGIPLPFVSYGLTSLVSMYIGIGLVLNVGMQPKKYQ